MGHGFYCITSSARGSSSKLGDIRPIFTNTVGTVDRFPDERPGVSADGFISQRVPYEGVRRFEAKTGGIGILYSSQGGYSSWPGLDLTEGEDRPVEGCLRRGLELYSLCG